MKIFCVRHCTSAAWGKWGRALLNARSFGETNLWSVFKSIYDTGDACVKHSDFGKPVFSIGLVLVLVEWLRLSTTYLTTYLALALW